MKKRGTNPRSHLDSTKVPGTNPRFERFLVKHEPKKSFRMSRARVRTHELRKRTQQPSGKWRVASGKPRMAKIKIRNSERQKSGDWLERQEQLKVGPQLSAAIPLTGRLADGRLLSASFLVLMHLDEPGGKYAKDASGSGPATGRAIGVGRARNPGARAGMGTNQS